ncbi:MAG: discoidin domain-containing protein [Bacteroidota bacterium]
MKFNLFTIAFLLMTQQLFAQCVAPDPNIWDDSWQSCQPSASPNPARGMSHWIQYDLTDIRRISKVHVWNVNELGKLGNGFNNVTVDYSDDGNNWIELGTYDWPQGNGQAIYGGFEGFDFQGNQARYILITANTNWGGPCYGLAEVKFNLLFFDLPSDPSTNVDDPEVVSDGLLMTVFPNPASQSAQVLLDTPSSGSGQLRIVNLMGQTVFDRRIGIFSGTNEYTLPLNQLINGMYLVFIQLDGQKDVLSEKLVVLKD